MYTANSCVEHTSKSNLAQLFFFYQLATVDVCAPFKPMYKLARTLDTETSVIQIQTHTFFRSMTKY